MRGDFSAARSAATAAGCQQYAGTRVPRHGAGLQRAPSSLPPAGGARRHPRICPWCWGRSARSRDLGAEQGLFLREPGSVRGAGVGRLGAEICPWCWGRSRLGTRLRVLRPWQDMVKRLCQRDSSAGLGGGRKRRRGLAAPGAERGFRNPHPAHDVQADLASAPKLEGSSSREMMRDYLDWGWGEKDAKQVMLPARVRGCTPQLSVLCSPQGQSLFRDQLVPSRAAPTD